VGLASLFPHPIRDGVLALGLSPTEVAAAGLVGLAGGAVDEALLAVIASFLVVAGVAPAVVPVLSGSTVDAADLAVRLALVLVAPLATGLGVRRLVRDARVSAVAERTVAPALALLVYRR
jgi:predicted Na+-dependent transporter